MAVANAKLASSNDLSKDSKNGVHFQLKWIKWEVSELKQI